ncbi:histidinol-phosphate transaminase [Pseudobacter ginsenosidimutans]|uniref:Histidinol-phosphate aminotransferase n=1 Tax=Pseudobacter ginsenosidimutans TaxID=661488 RepID=A0A4Q7MF70_9BACT|nr:histidinol-phosphate transaminase [Pseudobacter ginsenosidimutans]QEC45371.1 histidinol-phosphate transaminase [Pseudobacter ginsenosidimutans]RZS66895.1 histidinol-phosphate aminotransferase [Pseudobacter ginsenosidimutans]
MSFNLDDLLRPNIKNLVPYSSARDEFKGEASIFLDANENAYGSPLTKWYNRYPDPLQLKVKDKLSEVKGVPAGNIFIGNGSDECIDILIRAFCEPGKDNIIICPPTYGMYEVSANINDVYIKKVPLTADFQLDLPAIEEAVDDNTKIIFLCSPNNPTGNSLNREDLEVILNNYWGIIALDEAYINFSRFRSFTQELEDYPNLVVMQTLSKAWGLAALRVGLAFASEPIINVMNKVKPPYNINQASQELTLKALEEVGMVNDMIREIVTQRGVLETELAKLPVVQKIYPSDANFLLVRVTDAKGIYKYLADKGVVVRDRSSVTLCEGCLRITVGTEAENKALLAYLQSYLA